MKLFYVQYSHMYNSCFDFLEIDIFSQFILRVC